jgi:hypothetical protein
MAPDQTHGPVLAKAVVWLLSKCDLCGTGPVHHEERDGSWRLWHFHEVPSEPTPGTPHAPAEDACGDLVHENCRVVGCSVCAERGRVEPEKRRPATQPGAGATDAAGTETDRGTGERGTHGRSEVVSIEHGRQIAMTAMDLAEARWRHEHGQPHRREHCEACARQAVAEAARPVHYREAAKSIRAMADADEAAEPPIGCEINYLRGLRRAADLLDSTARDLTEGEPE